MRRRLGCRRRAAALAAVLGLAGSGLAACGGSDDASGPSSDLSASSPALWNPCDGLRTPAVSSLVDATLTRDAGTPTEPRCRFTPTTHGRPAIDVNYQLYPGTLTQLIDSFGEGSASVRTLEVPRSDGARLIVHTGRQTLAVTGFVQNGDLVQVVNLVDPSPYRRQQLLDAVTGILDDLAAHAASSGLTGASTRGSSSRAPSPSSSPGG